MGSDGGVWDTADVILKARMNRKTLLSDTGANISSATTYAGMLAYCTSTGSGFVADILYERNAANTAWSVVGADLKPYLTLSTTIGDYTSPNASTASSTYTTATFTDDGTSYADQTAYDAVWVSSDTAVIRGSPTNDRIEQVIASDGTENYIYYDLGSALSDSAFVFRFSINKVTTSGTFNIRVGLSSNSSGHATAQDGLFLAFASGNIYAEDCDGVDLDSGTLNITDVTQADGVTYYYEISRTSATQFLLKAFTDSSYTTQTGTTETVTIASTVQSLRYIKITERPINNATTATIYIDDFEIHNGITSVTSYAAANVYDGSTSSQWRSTSSNNPNIYVDLSGSAREIVGLAINLDRTTTTATSLKIRASTDTSFDDTENIAYLNVTDFTDDTWRYIANNFLPTNCRYIQIYANENSCVLAINEIKVRYGVSDGVKILGHKHRTRTTTSSDSFVDSN